MNDDDALLPRTLTLGELKAFAERHGLGDDTEIWMDRDRDEPDPHNADVFFYDYPADGVRAEVFTDGTGHLIITISG